MNGPLQDDRDYWDRHARRDPLWAVLSEHGKRNRGWNLPAFMESGEREVSLLLYELKRLGIKLRCDRALDFGCGVGRITQGLARRFALVLGIDISPRMIDLAERFNQFPGRVDYRTNDSSLIAAVDQQRFDFIYSNIVLQHIRPEISRSYIADFIKVLGPGGVLVFQLPAHRADARELTPLEMPARAYQAQIMLPCTIPQTIQPAAEIPLVVLVRNLSDVAWTQFEYGSMRIGNHWLDPLGAMLIQDDGRASLPSVLTGGEESAAHITVRAPDEIGRFILEIDVVHEGITWFHDRGSATVRIPVVVASSGRSHDRATAEPGAEPPLHAYAAVDLDALLDASGTADDPEGFPMYGIEKEEVVEIVARAGGQMIHVVEDDRAKPEWVGYKYFVVKPDAEAR